jgi:hypothetical protein
MALVNNDLYVVYTRKWIDDTSQDRFETLDRRAAANLLYIYRL